MNEIEINGKKISYREKGQGKALILLHNGFYTTQTWNGIRDVLADNFLVIDYNRFGYGESSLYESNLNIDIVAHGVDELHEFIEKKNLGKVHLCGHCLGGAIAALYTAANPDKVDKLVLEAAGFFCDEKIKVKSDFTFQEFAELDKNLILEMKKMHGETYLKTFWNLLRSYHGGYIMDDSYNILDKVKKIKKEVLLISGDRDFYFDMDHIVQAYRKIRRSRLWIAPNCGHDVHLEQKDKFLEYVINFLKDR